MVAVERPRGKKELGAPSRRERVTAFGGWLSFGGKPRAIDQRMAGKQEDEYQFLPVRCPHCGLEGKVRISRLDRSFTCKKCCKVFHVTLDGTVTGERPPGAAAVDPADMVAEETQTRFEKWLARLPRVWQMVLGGACLLALGAGIKILTEPEVPLPGELEARAKFAAQALARGQWGQVKRLALPGTAKDLGGWYDKVRPESWSDVGSESRVNVEVGNPSKQLRGYAKNEPILDSGIAVTIEVPGKGKLEDVRLTFSQDENLEWWLNGERMLKESTASK